MAITVRAEKVSHGFQIFLPGNFVKGVTNLRDLKRMLNPYHVCDDMYVAFESELLSEGKATISISPGKFFQI